MSDKPIMPPSGMHTPGWNDPPNIQFNPLTSGSSVGKPRVNLNKRIAFPLQGMTTLPSPAKPTAIVQPSQTITTPPPSALATPSSLNSPLSHQPVAVVHPMPNANVPPPLASRIPMPAPPANFQQEQGTLPSDAEQRSIEIFLQHVPLIHDFTNIRREEVERRIALLEELWRTGGLSQVIQWKIYQIAIAISANNLSEAMEAYTTLVVNHSNECSSFAVAIRHIVLALQTQANVNLRLSSNNSNNSEQDASSFVSSIPNNFMFVPAMPRTPGTTPTSTFDESTLVDEINSLSSVQNI